MRFVYFALLPLVFSTTLEARRSPRLTIEPDTELTGAEIVVRAYCFIDIPMYFKNHLCLKNYLIQNSLFAQKYESQIKKNGNESFGEVVISGFQGRGESTRGRFQLYASVRLDPCTASIDKLKETKEDLLNQSLAPHFKRIDKACPTTSPIQRYCQNYEFVTSDSVSIDPEDVKLDYSGCVMSQDVPSQETQISPSTL